MVGNPTQAACVVSALTEPKPECSQSQPRSHTGSLQIPQRARCQATPLRSVREMCLLLTSPYIEPSLVREPVCADRSPSGRSRDRRRMTSIGEIDLRAIQVKWSLQLDVDGGSAFEIDLRTSR